MSQWKKKKAYHKSEASIMPAGGKSTGKSPDATFVPDNLSKNMMKKHADFHKKTTPMPMGRMKPMVGE